MAEVTSGAVDTSVLVSAHVAGHVHRGRAAPAAADATHVIGPVVAETWSVLRRHFRLPATEVEIALRTYVQDRILVVPDVDVYRELVDVGAGLGLAGNVHDFVIVHTASNAGVRLVTFDRGMARLSTATVSPLT